MIASDNPSGLLVDPERSARLHDVGQPDYLAVVAVAADGSERLVLAQRAELGDNASRFDSSCSGALHEQLGPLPLDWVRRITIASRSSSHRCGRPTKAGHPCRTPVAAEGQVCGRHRATKVTDR